MEELLPNRRMNIVRCVIIEEGIDARNIAHWYVLDLR